MYLKFTQFCTGFFIIALLLPLSFALPRETVAAESDELVASWDMEEGSGGTITDSVSGLVGTLESGVSWTEGRKKGTALLFDGSNTARVVVPKNSAPQLGELGTITVSAWVYANEAHRGRIVSQGDGNNRVFTFGTPNQNVIRFTAGYTEQSATWDTSPESFIPGEWHFVELEYTFDSGESPIISINGTPQELTVVSEAAGERVQKKGSLYIGANNKSHRWNGVIDSLKIGTKVDTRPNIIIIMTDDQDLESMDVMNQVQKHLTNKGVTFENSFVNFPLCCPSRVSFLMGQAAHNTGIIGNNKAEQGGFDLFDDSNTLPVWLNDAGYETALIGKYINGYGNGPKQDGYVPPGWTHWIGGVGRYYNYEVNENGTLVPYGADESDYATDVITRKSVSFIKETPSNKPFFLFITQNAPHKVFEPAIRHKGAFSSYEVNIKPNFNEANMSDKPDYINHLPLLTDEEVERNLDAHRTRREMMLSVDEMVTDIIQALKDIGELDNTYIAFTSDHGFSLGEHRIKSSKRAPYEENIRVPLIIRGPDIPKGITRDHLVNNLDLVASIVDWAEATPGVTLDGRSLKRAIQRPNKTWRTAIPIEGTSGELKSEIGFWGRYSGVRTDRYLYVEHTHKKTGEVQTELYDMVKDPYQLTNRTGRAKYKNIEKELADIVDQTRDCAGSNCWITSAEPEAPNDSLTATVWHGITAAFDTIASWFDGSENTATVAAITTFFNEELLGDEIFSFKRDLSQGMEGEDVEELQIYLSQFKDIYPEGDVTGFYGAETAAAVERYQKKYAAEILDVENPDTVGVVGPLTRIQLNLLAIDLFD